MFLKNFYRTLGSFFMATNSNINIGTSGEVVTTTYDLHGFGTEASGGTYSFPQIRSLQKTYNGSGGVILGTGDTEPSFEDYCLSGDIISNFTYTSSVTKNINSEKATISALYTITNTGSEAFTIREIALKMGHYSDTQFLIERTVLNTPVTIEAGGVGQVIYTITFKYPTAAV